MVQRYLNNPGDLFLFNEHPSPILIFDFDTLEIVEVNDASVDKYGYTKLEFRDLTVKDIRPKEDISKLKNVLGDDNNKKIYADVYRHQKKNGETFYVRVVGQSYPHEERNLRIAYIFDITEQVEIQRTLSETYNELYHHVNNSPLALVKWNSDFEIIEWSDRAEEIAGFTKEEVLGRSPFEFDYSDASEKDRFKDLAEQFLCGKLEKDQQETQLYSKDGRLLDIKLYSSALRDDSGNLKSVITFFEDITGRKRKEEKIKAQNYLIKFAHTLSQKISGQTTYRDALAMTIREIAEFLEWEVGHAYILDKDGEFVTFDIWYLSDEERLDAFKKVTSKTGFKQDKGFVGRIIKTSKPGQLQNLAENDLFIRETQFEEVELRSAFAFPVSDQDTVREVLEFFTEKDVALDEPYLEQFFTIGSQLGSVLRRIKTKEKLKQSEQKFRSIFKNANDGIFLMKGEYFVECNDEVTRMFEVPKDEIIGKTPFDFSPEKQPDGRDSYEKGREKIEAALSGKPQRFEWRQVTDSGNKDVEVALNRLDLPGGTYLQAIVRDLTLHKKARQELQKREEMFRRLFLQAPAALVMVDEENRVTMVNNSFEELFGYSEGELTGRDLDQVIVPEEDYEDAPKMPAEEFKNTSYYHEGTRITKSGERRDVFVGSIPVYINDRPLAGFGMYIDITEQKRNQAELKKSLEEKNVLLSEIHHRVKNNLAVISGLLQLKRMKIDNEEISNVLYESQMRIHSMAMIHEKLYESRDFANLKFGSYVEELVDVITGTIEDTSKEISVNVDSDDLELTINQAIPSALIINEMVTNAFEYAFPEKQSGTINVSLKEYEKEHVRLKVWDDGVGLPEGFDERTFESLGLTLIQRLTNQLHGKLEYGNDDGAYFQVSFQKSDKPGSSSHFF